MTVPPKDQDKGREDDQRDTSTDERGPPALCEPYGQNDGESLDDFDKRSKKLGGYGRKNCGETGHVKSEGTIQLI
jgi:hypothetical protein